MQEVRARAPAEAGRWVARITAAFALGQIADPLALPALQTGYDLEGEPVTRGFLLLSIGEQGGDPARAFLGSELEEGPQIMQPWSALALRSAKALAMPWSPMAAS